MPLVLFSHGNGGSRIESAWLTHALAKKGYIVASVEHFGNTWDLFEINECWQRWKRAQDISFVIRELLKNPEFSDIIDEDSIGFAGFSLGGLTGIWLAGGQAKLIESAFKHDPEFLKNTDLDKVKESYHDPLIKAEFLMAPAYGLAFDSESLNTIKIPIYIAIGGNDKIVPKCHAVHLNKYIPKCSLNVIGEKVGHFVFLNRPTLLGKIVLPKEIIFDHLWNNTLKIQENLINEATGFFNRHLIK